MFQWQPSDGQTRGPAIYVAEGFTVVVSSGGTELPGLPSMTSIAPPTPNPSNSECNNLDAAITAAESDMNSTINTNVPKVDYLLKGSTTLRNLRARIKLRHGLTYKESVIRTRNLKKIV